MNKKKVIELFNNANANQYLASAETQLDLFPTKETLSRKYIFLNIDNYNQDSLKNILAKNNPSVIVDIRRFPVFNRPNYDHLSIYNYIFSRNFSYVEIDSSLIFNIFSGDKNLKYTPRISSIKTILKEIDNGLCIIFTDDSIESSGLLSEARRIIENSELSFYELHPLSLR